MTSQIPTKDSEVIIGLVGPVGTELKKVHRHLKDRLKRHFKYQVQEINVSQDIIPAIIDLEGIDFNENEFLRISSLMDAGNKARELTNNSGVLAFGSAAEINKDRSEDNPFKGKQAVIIDSLKRPEEVEVLREIYEEGFFLIGVFSEEKERRKYLHQDKDIDLKDANTLIDRDMNENRMFGQRTRDTFHLSDFFIHFDGDEEKLKNDLIRILNLIFGHPYITPTFDEYAMFMAFSASLCSADLSRQVGAVIAKNDEIYATGANDVPKFNGGLYMAKYDPKEKSIVDDPKGRDYIKGYDSNKKEKNNIIADILDTLHIYDEDRIEALSSLRDSKIHSITEYGRAVHAEMEALLSCGRKNLSAVGGTLYCTTFPCHNCAKHIIAAGIKKVVYVEPYEKSKAIENHADAISRGFPELDETVNFVPFVGVGPRRFFDLFSTKLGSGYPIERKKKDGTVVDWTPQKAVLRTPLQPITYFEREADAARSFDFYQEELNKNEEGQ